jgi:glycerol kinase
VVATCREALKTANLGAADIVAIGITNQRETVVIWDKATGKPIHNAIDHSCSSPVLSRRYLFEEMRVIG